MMVLLLWNELFDVERYRTLRRHIRECGACKRYYTELREAKKMVLELAAGRRPRKEPSFLPKLALRLAAPLAVGIAILFIPNPSAPPWPPETVIDLPAPRTTSLSLLNKKRENRVSFSKMKNRLRSRIERAKRLFAKLW